MISELCINNISSYSVVYGGP